MNSIPVRVLEDVFVTEGVPEETFIRPPNFSEILVDMRHTGKPVIIEGPSGTGKTSTAKKILETLGKNHEWLYLSSRRPEDILYVEELSRNLSPGVFIIDDFHRLPPHLQSKISDIAKQSAEEDNPVIFPKLILIGINQVGTSLIHFSPDIAKRCGIHKIRPASLEQTKLLIKKGCDALNIQIDDHDQFYTESGGDYWLIQTLCKAACTLSNIIETQESTLKITPNLIDIRKSIVDRLEAAYYESIKEFCRGRRFRPSNDVYFRLLQFIATKSNSSSVDLIELANANKEIAGSINNIKTSRLAILLKEKHKAGQYFYYEKESSRFSIEDPAVFYYIKNLDWIKARRDCGFREKESMENIDFDLAISFAGENRELARYIVRRLSDLDVHTYFDEDYESNYLGKRLTDEFRAAFHSNSRFVICLLDNSHLKKIWPTFERDVFLPRVEKQEVIPIYLDDTRFPGIPGDLYGIKLSINVTQEGWQQIVDDNIVLKILDKIG